VSETKELLRRGIGEFEPMPDAFDRVLARRDRKRRNRRVAAAALGIALFALVMVGIGGLIRSSAPTTIPGDDPEPSPTEDLQPLWPQSSIDEVNRAQELADAGDPRYTWQVDPDFQDNIFMNPPEVEIINRFLRQELGWEEFRSGPFLAAARGARWIPGEGLDVRDPGVDPHIFTDVVYIRCATGGANPLYPDDMYGRGCAPTIDDVRYETVRIDVARLGRPGSYGIWAVTGWTPGPVVAQTVPPSGAEVAAVVEPFLQACVDGEGAERYLLTPEERALEDLYATSTGASYERYEYEIAGGPVWPSGSMELEVRLFADGGETVVRHRVGVSYEEGLLVFHAWAGGGS
jgi:hypothetical protein